MKSLFPLGHHQSANEVVRLIVRKSLDVQVYLGLRLRESGRPVDINSVLSDGKCLQREVMRECRTLCSLAWAARSESVGKLLNGEYPSAAVAGTFGLGD